MATAQAIKAKRQIEIQNGQYDFTRQFKEDILFLPYFREMIEERGKNADSKGNYGNWKSCLRYLEIYCDEKTTFRDVTPEFVQGFKDYLDVADKKTSNVVRMHQSVFTKSYQPIRKFHTLIN